jgi:DNA-binding NtrC family response regulator
MTRYGEMVRGLKRRLLRRVVRKVNGRVAEAARMLGVERTTLWEMLTSLGVDPKPYRVPKPRPPPKKRSSGVADFVKGSLLR